MDYNSLNKFIMQDADLANVISRAYAGTAADEKRLLKLGVTKPIYRGYKGEFLGRFRLRKGELLGVVRGYRAFGDARKDWIQAETIVHGFGAVIVDLDSGLRSDCNGAKMVSRAINPPRPSEVYQEMQAASVAQRVKGRMKTRQAEKIWFNPKLSIREKVDLTGIPQATLYAMYGKTGVPQGRRRK